MYYRTLALAVMIGSVLLQTGCSTAVREARGAWADVLIIEDTQDLASYRQVSLQSLDNNLGPGCSYDMDEAVRKELTEDLATLSGSIPGDEPVLRVKAVIDYYQDGSGVRTLIGEESRCHVRLKMLGADEDQVLAEVLVSAASGAVLRSEHKHLAKEISEVFLEYLRNRGMRPPTTQPASPTTQPGSTELAVAAS
jgi:hypothetical protein